MAGTIATPRRATTGPSRRRGGRGALAAGLILVIGALATLVWVLIELNDPLMDREVAAQEVASARAAWEASEPAPGAGFEVPTAPARPLPGGVLALLRIPDFGADFEVPIVVGVEPADLRKGVGWHADTAEPGAIGNFAIAGHRGARGPFVPLPDLQPGAQVIVETRDAIYTYILDNRPADLRVLNTETWVIDPVPGSPGVKPTQARITLYTCSELFHSPWRTVAFGHLVSTVPKAR